MLPSIWVHCTLPAESYFGEIDVLRSLIDLAAEIAGSIADDIDIAVASTAVACAVVVPDVGATLVLDTAVGVESRSDSLTMRPCWSAAVAVAVPVEDTVCVLVADPVEPAR